MPKVSVLLANYNGEKHLHEAIESVLEQTYQDFEFVMMHQQIHRGRSLKIIMIKE